MKLDGLCKAVLGDRPILNSRRTVPSPFHEDLPKGLSGRFDPPGVQSANQWSSPSSSMRA